MLLEKNSPRGNMGKDLVRYLVSFLIQFMVSTRSVQSIFQDCFFPGTTEPGENEETAKLYLRPHSNAQLPTGDFGLGIGLYFWIPWPQQLHRCHAPRGLHQLRYRLSGCSGTQCHLIASKALRD